MDHDGLNAPEGTLLTPLRFLQVASVFGVSLAAVDMTAGMLEGVLILRSWSFIVPMAATTAIFGAVVFAATWLIAGWPLARFSGANRAAMACAVAAFLGVFLSLGRVLDLFQIQKLRSDTIPTFLQLDAIGTVAFVCGLGAYFAVRTLLDMPRLGWWAVAAFRSLPFIAAETLVFAWLMTYVVGDLSVFVATGVYVAYGIVAVLTIVIFAEIGRLVPISAAPIVLGVAVCASPFAIRLDIREFTDRPFEPTQQDPTVKHVFLVVMDTLRQDGVTAYNTDGVPSPQIDAFAKDAVVFRNAYSTSGWTLPAMASIMTGFTPEVHLATTGYKRLSNAFTTLAERMEAAGYYSGAIGQNTLLRPDRNMTQGFHHYDFYPRIAVDRRTIAGKVLHRVFPEGLQSHVTTSEITDKSVAWVEANQDEPFFLWTHYYDPHTPHTPPERFILEEGVSPTFGKTFYGAQYVHRIRSGLFVPTDDEKMGIKTLYESEKRYVDHSFGRLMDNLRRMGLYEDALIILTSDHGEEFWEHRGYEHGHTLYDELLRVPLIIKLPRSSATGVRDAFVSNGSLLPAILDVCGIAYEDGASNMPSLAPLLENEPEESVGPLYARGVYAYEDKEAIIDRPFKFIRYLQSNHVELYNLETDPAESVSLVRDHPDVVEHMVNMLDARNHEARQIRKRLGVGESDGGSNIDPATRDLLRDLGYLD